MVSLKKKTFYAHFKDKMIVKGNLKKLIELSKSKSWMNIKMVEAPKNE